MRTHTDRDLRMLAARSSVGLPHRVPPNLAGADLDMATLPHVDLSGANLEGASLRGAMLWGALLDDACLDDADLTCADLTWSSLCRCSAKGTLLVEADLDEALTGYLSGAVTAGASKIATHMCEEVLRLLREFRPDALKEMMPPPSEEELARDEAVLRAHKRSAPLTLRKRGAAGFALSRGKEGATADDDPIRYKMRKLRQARARVLSDADLQELLSWSASTGKPLNLRGCTLTGARLRNASLRGACLAFTNATGADLHGVDLAGADLEGSIGWERPS